MFDETDGIVIPTPQQARREAAEKLKPEVLKLVKTFKDRLLHWDGASEIIIHKNQINDLVNQEFLRLFKETEWTYTSSVRKESDMRGDSWDVPVFVFKASS